MQMLLTFIPAWASLRRCRTSSMGCSEQFARKHSALGCLDDLLVQFFGCLDIGRAVAALRLALSFLTCSMISGAISL